MGALLRGGTRAATRAAPTVVTRLSVLAMPLHPSFTHAIKSSPKELLPSKEKKGGGAPKGAPRCRIEMRCGAHPDLRSSNTDGRSEAASDLMERARSPFGAPPRLFRLRPRFLESPDASGRTLSGTSAASTSQSGHAPDGTLPKPPVDAVYRRATREPPPLRLKEYPREWRPIASGMMSK